MNFWKERIEGLNERRLCIYSFLFFLILSVLTRLPVFFFDFFSNDEAAHFIGSIILKKGLNLYTDFVDNKPPLIYVFYLFSQAIFGESITAVHITTTVLIIPLIAFFTSLVLIKKNRFTGLIAGSFYIIFTSAYIPTDMFATNCEIVMLLFTSVAFLFLLQDKYKGYFLFGTFIGLATLSKQHAAIWILIPIIAELKKDRDKSISKPVLSLIGFSIPLLITILYFYLQGNLEDFIYFTVKHNIGYSQNPIPLSEILKRLFKYLLPFILIISPMLFFYIKGRREIERDILKIFESALLLSVLMIFLGFRFFPHYFIQAVYPLSVLSAFYFRRLEDRAVLLRLFLVYALILILAFNSYTFLSYSKETGFIEETEPLFRVIPQKIKEDGCCNGCFKKNYRHIFIWGYAPLFYYYFYKKCSLLPASRFVLPQASTAGYIPGNESQMKEDFKPEKYLKKEHRDLLIEDLIKNTPAIIIDTSPSNFHNWRRYPLTSFPELNEFIQKNYVFYKNINGYNIYIK